MRNVANFLLFQAFWFAAVLGAAAGRVWLGPLAALAVLAAHLWMVGDDRERRRELSYVLAVGLLGTLVDSFLRAIGATAYPTSEGAWPFASVPPWITSLWVAFAMLPASRSAGSADVPGWRRLWAPSADRSRTWRERAWAQWPSARARP